MRDFGFSRARLRIAATAALLLASAGAPAAAQAPGAAACRAALAGTYLADIATEAGAFASRALVTLHADGTLDVVDSRQHQGVHGSSFSAQRGAWRCTGARAAAGVTLNFGFPPQESVARSDWTIARDPAGALRGTIALTIFPGVAGVDPWGAGGRRFGVFRFAAARVAPRN
jgi:hypothetical protein